MGLTVAEPVPTQVVEVAAVRRQECLEAAAQTVGTGRTDPEARVVEAPHPEAHCRAVPRPRHWGWVGCYPRRPRK